MKKYVLFVTCYFCFTINNYAQCIHSTHSTNPQDSWLSCTTEDNPNPNRDNSHWMLYDLGYVYNLTSTKFWNYNVANATDKGFRNMAIDYSMDGATWMNATSFELAKASGLDSYEGMIGPDLGGISARYILLTALDTWGNPCAGLSEVRFDVDSSLGILLRSFKATCQDEKVQLHWETSLEQGNDFFLIEKSIDAHTWQTLDKVYHQSNSSQIASYTWTAKDIHTTDSYYRLVQIDLDGKTKIFPFIWVESCTTRPSLDFTIYPNPATTTLQLDLDNDGLDITDIIIRSASGHEVQRIMPQNVETFIDVSNLPNGIYFLTVLTKNQGQLTQRFVKTK